VILGLEVCKKDSFAGYSFWTAGYRAFSSNFGWKLKSSRNQQLSSGDWTTHRMSYSFWAPGEPNNHGGNENCVAVWPNRNYHWNDSNCEKLYCFVCEDRNAPTVF